VIDSTALQEVILRTIHVKQASDLDVVSKVVMTLFTMNGEQDVTICDHENSRTLAQNKLSFKWYSRIAEEFRDRTVDEVRAECKLTLGVPIRREDEKFRIVYDEHVRPLPYETKIAYMVEPIDFPITRDMGVKTMSRYLESVEKTYAMQGIILPRPEDMYYLAMGIKRKDDNEKKK
jgi:hypothetical protein